MIPGWLDDSNAVARTGGTSPKMPRRGDCSRFNLKAGQTGAKLLIMDQHMYVYIIIHIHYIYIYLYSYLCNIYIYIHILCDIYIYIYRLI